MLANRLTEVDEWSVLVLEAGGDETLQSDVPAFAADLQGSKLDWRYKTEPMPNACLAFKNRRYLHLFFVAFHLILSHIGFFLHGFHLVLFFRQLPRNGRNAYWVLSSSTEFFPGLSGL